VAGVGLQLLACCDSGFESRRWYGCLLLVNVVLCQLQVTSTGRSLVRSSPTECGASECDRGTSQRRLRPTGAVHLEEEEDEKNKNKKKKKNKEYKCMQS
jgi:hypothetical protein